MADQVKVEVLGMRRFVATLRDAGADLNELKDATAAALRIAVAAAVRTAPVRTGALAASGKGNRAKRRAVITFGSARVPYAGAIHWGWPRRHITPNPWVSRAAQATEPQWLAAYMTELDAIFARVQGV